MNARYASLLLLVPVAATAQPILQSADVQVMGNTYAIHLVTDPGASDPNADGANVTWDFSSATLTMNAGSTTFMAPAGTPYAASYPTSNLAQSVTIPGSTTYTYFNLQSAQLDMLGQEIGGSDPTVYTDPKTPLQFPMAYEDWFIDYYEYDGTEYSVSRAYMGYGTVILPTGTYTNVVKVASTSGAINFYRTDPVMELVNIDGEGQILVFGDAQVGVEEASMAQPLSIFPLPATDVVNIGGLTGASTWDLIDAQGRVLRSGRDVRTTLVLDVNTLASGPYSVIVRDGRGQRSARILKQ
ncbi:MAG: T9SS type A sorting domain-containing protein [Flavobacteriales bacterium]|nr:MAG: T9SS type A sorting domain-containing protein [Flavobacteriales bacterium]